MSSYKGHSIFALILSLMFFHSPLLIALTLIGANIPDFDHKFKKDNVYKLIILGLIVFISLYILKLPYFIGLIIVFLGVCFYFSEHRSFTHSIFGAIILTASVSLILIWAFLLVINFTNINNYYFIMAVLIALLSFLHIVLDSFTPSGIKIFAPISSKKVYSNFGKVSIFVLVLLAIVYNAQLLFNMFEQYVYILIASIW